MMKKKKQLLIILVCVVLAVCFLPLPTRINKELTGTGFYPKGHEQESVVTEETLCIKGWYLRFLIWNNRFWGDVQVVSEDPEHERMLVDTPSGVLFMRGEFFSGSMGHLPYYDGRINQIRYTGILVEKGAFDEVIYLSNDDDHHMAFPAMGREEAVALVNKLYLPIE